jgi:hypothetical protein
VPADTIAFRGLRVRLGGGCSVASSFMFAFSLESAVNYFVGEIGHRHCQPSRLDFESAMSFGINPN